LKLSVEMPLQRDWYLMRLTNLEMFEPESRKAAGQFKRFRVRAVASPKISGNGALLFDAQEAH
jgi:hypothetical protein